MNSLFEARLKALSDQGPENVISGGLKGLEKESLRVSPVGLLSQRLHPIALGSALTNKYVTTDFSEALLEFVTPPVGSSWEAAQFLCDLHQYAHAAVGDEILWPMSMPCRIESDTDVPIALYGSSNVGRMKNVYRRGLGYR